MVVAVEVQNRGKTWRGSSKSFLACSPHQPLQLIPDVGQNPIGDRATSTGPAFLSRYHGLRASVAIRGHPEGTRELDKKGCQKAFTSSSLVLI